METALALEAEEIDSQPFAQWFRACIYGNLDLVKLLINHYDYTSCRTPNIKLTESDDSSEAGLILQPREHLWNTYVTPLHVASFCGHLNIVNFLVSDAKCDLNCENHQGFTPLHMACHEGHLQIVKYLFSHKCNPHWNMQHNRTPFAIACQMGHLHIAEYLIERNPQCVKITTKNQIYPLHLACRGGHLGMVKFLVEKHHCDPECISNNGLSPLHLACNGGHFEISKYLITTQNISPQCTSETLNTPLHSASWSGNLDLVKYLINDHQCDPCFKNKFQRTPLHYACLSGQLEVAKYLNNYLIEHHQNPESSDIEGNKPLHLACKYGHLPLVQYFCEVLCTRSRSGLHIADCIAACTNSLNQTPLHLACLGGHSHVVDHLFTQYNCSPNCSDKTGMTPLHIASEIGNLRLIKHLFKHPLCDPNSQTKFGYSPLHLAYLEGHSHVVAHLVTRYNCSPSCSDETGMTPLHIVSKMGNLRLVKHLLQHPRCDPNSQTESGYTPLHLAYLERHSHVVKYLVTQDSCNPNCADKTGMTPLHIVSKMGDLNLVKCLFKNRHCDPNSQTKCGYTPLHLACLKGHSHVVEHLVTQYNCNPNCADETGMTPLHIVSKMGYLNLVKYLFKNRRCDPNSQTKSGYTALHFACEEGHLSIVKYFCIAKSSNPECETIAGDTPFMLACSSNHEDVAKFLLPQCDPLHLNKKGKGACVKSPTLRKAISDFYMTKKKHPIESYIKIFILGDPDAGKSTLVQALQGNQSLMNVLFRQQVPENKVSKQTSGIDTFTYNSKSFGNVVIYDFAGQYEYYTSNAAFLQNFTSRRPGAIFLLVINASLEIRPSLLYWLSFITDNWAHNKTKAHVFVVGSHVDKIQGDIEEVYSTIEKVAHSHDADYALAGVVCLDCRYQTSKLGHLCALLERECTNLRTDTIDGRCYVLYDHIKKTYPKQTCTLLELTQDLHDHPFLPPEPNDLLKLLKLLHDKGQVILLEDCKNCANSWIIDNVQLLLKTVVGTVFAPTDFKKHLQVSNEMGIVSRDEIVEVFNDVEVDSSLIIGFLEHFHFCHRVDPTRLGLDEDESYFFPALVTKNRPPKVWNKKHLPHFNYHCGWCMQCCRQDNDQAKFLPARWLHDVLLQLAYKFVLPLEEDRPHSIGEKSGNLQGHSKIWKNGIFWCDKNGICTLFEATEHMHTVLLIMSCPSNYEIDCVRLRSELIHVILNAVEDICPQNTKDLREYIIDPINPSELYNKPQLASNLQAVSVQTLVQDLFEERNFWDPDPMKKARELLYFEPYTVFSQQAVEQLLSKENSLKVVSNEFIAQLALWASDYDANNGLQKIFRPYRHEIVDDNSSSVCKDALESWKNRSGCKKATYLELNHELEKYSIFKGRNPFVSY